MPIPQDNDDSKGTEDNDMSHDEDSTVAARTKSDSADDDGSSSDDSKMENIERTGKNFRTKHSVSILSLDINLYLIGQNLVGQNYSRT